MLPFFPYHEMEDGRTVHADELDADDPRSADAGADMIAGYAINGKVSVFYFNKKEAQALYAQAGAQFTGMALQDGLIHNIHDTGSPVKRNYLPQTDTRQFNRWFGDSQMKNEDGTPKVFYHGTMADFDVFGIKKAKSTELKKQGFAAPEDMTALSYAADQLARMARDTGEKYSAKMEAPSSYIQEHDGMTEEQKETLRGYLYSVDPQIKKAAQEYKNNKQSPDKRMTILDVSEREAEDIKAIIGIDVTGYKHDVDKSFFDHVDNRHGDNGEHDNTMADLNDVARVKWVIKNYDTISPGKKIAKGYLDKNRNHMQTIIYEKKLDGKIYVVEAVGENNWKKLHLVSAYIEESSAKSSQSGAVTQSPHADNSLRPHVQDVNASPADNSITQGNDTVKYSKKLGISAV